MKEKIFSAGLVLALCLGLVGCRKASVSETVSGTETAGDEKKIVVGFSQLGAESDWRSKNTESMKAAFTAENGYELIFEDGQQKQSNQIMAVRTFIQQEVDYIVLAPVIETGWDTVLQEAKDAGIPVILVDRMVDVTDDSLYTAWVGSDFDLEGRKACEWLSAFLDEKELGHVNIVNIQGTIGASAQIGRTGALEELCMGNERVTLLDEVTGDFTQARGKEVMESLLKKYEDIDIVYCENDNEAFGAIEAIEASGQRAGSDIAGGEVMVLSFDGVKKDGMKYVQEDRISFIAECNPLQGPYVREIIETLEEGKTPQKFSYVDERMFAHDDTVASVTVDGTEYPVNVVNEEVLEKHIYD